MKILILVPLAVFAAIFAIGPGGIVSYAPASRVGVHTVIAFWISIPTALAILSYQRTPVRANVVILSALIFALVVHIGSAVKNMLRLTEPIVDRVLVDTITDLLEFALFGVLISGAMICATRQLQPKMDEKWNLTSVAILILPLALYGGLWLTFQFLHQDLLVIVGWVIGIIALIGYLFPLTLIPRFKQEGRPYDAGYFVSALLLLCVATLATISNLADPSMNWEYAETLQMAAFLLLCLALGVPFLKNSGYGRRSAYGFVMGLVLMAYLPFLFTIVIDSLSLDIFIEQQNLLAYSIIHIGAASLSGMMAILLHIYPKKKTSWNHYPLILLFGLWAAISLILVFIFTVPILVLGGEPIIPFVVGSIITLGLLIATILWTTKPPTERTNPTILRLGILLSVLISLVILGEVVNQLTIDVIPPIADSPYGAIVLLGTNLVIMLTFTYLIFLFAEDSRGKPPVEMYIVFFLGMWILPNILKSYNTTWSAGWWISEILLFVGLLAGPPLLIWLYIRAMRHEQDSHMRAGLYADILMHDISNYNQMVMTTLELLGSEDISEEQRKRLADDGNQAISFSEQLISNVRLLSESDRLEQPVLEPINLVSTIVSALDTFTQRVGTDELTVEFKPSMSQSIVMANDLLVHIFLNILYSALECRLRGEIVTIGIQSIQQEGDQFWQIAINAPGKSIEDENEYSSGMLGLTAAELMTTTINGQFEMERYSRIGKCDGRLFTILFHAMNDDE
ncbi:MAG: hypothetical protein ACXACG_00130 [Candidatus Thorarchaeota archaeon]